MQPDKFDKQIREVLSKQHFAYDPAAWEAAAAMLDQEQAKKRVLWWIWPLLGLLLLLGAWGAVYFAPNFTAKKVESSPVVQTPPMAPISNLTEEATAPSTSAVSPAQPTPSLSEQSSHSQSPGFYGQKRSITSATPSLNTSDSTITQQPTTVSTNTSFNTMPMLRSNWLQRVLLNRQPVLKESPLLSSSFEYKKPRPWQSSIGLSGQLGIGQQNTEDARMISYGGGVFFEIRKNKWFLAIEPNLQRVQGLAGVSVRRDTTYAFGRTIHTQTLRWDDLLLFQMPILLGYECYPKHTLAAGLGTQQYLHSRYTRTENVEIQGSPPIAETQSSGLARISEVKIPPIFGLVRYQFQMSNAFSIGMQYRLKNRSSLDQNLTPWQLQMKYHLFNRQRP